MITNKFDDLMNNVIAPWAIKMVIAVHLAVWTKIVMDIVKL